MKSQIAFVALSAVTVAVSAHGQAAMTHHAGTEHMVAAASTTSRVTVRKDGIRSVTVTASDYAFAGPDTIPAGLTEFRLQNRGTEIDRKSTRLNSSHVEISYAVFC